MLYPPVFYFLLTLCLLLAAGLTVAALRRANRQRLVLRIVAAGLAALGLWWMAYPPRQTVPEARAEAVVLTPGYQPDSLRQLLRRLGPATRLWRQGFTTASDTPALAGLQPLREQYPLLRRLHVLGRGLSTAELLDAGSLQVVAHRPPLFQGFQQASWSRRQAMGQWVQLAGTFSASVPAVAQPVWLSLQGPGRSADSVRLKAGQGIFRLRILPKTSGLAVYRLVARRGGHVIAAEPVPVEITAPQPLRVLLLSSTASFEFTFLKNYLGAQQHRVALRTGISRGLAQTEFLNQPTHDLTRLTSALLSRYDVVIADAGSFGVFSGSENQALQAAVRTSGLGLIVLADAAALPRALPTRASFTVMPRIITDTNQSQAVRWPDAPGPATTLVPATLRVAATTHILVVNGSREPVVAVQRLGMGSVLVSALPQTYPWALQNTVSPYAAFWSHLLGAVARPLGTLPQWHVLTTWPRSQTPVDVRLNAAVWPNRLPTVVGPQPGAPVRLALRQAAQVPEWATAQFWPTTSGWHHLQLLSQPAAAFYVFSAAAWQGPEQTLRQQAMARLAAAAAASPPATTSRPAYPIGWFFALFVLAAGFLWLEEKL